MISVLNRRDLDRRDSKITSGCKTARVKLAGALMWGPRAPAVSGITSLDK